MDISTISNIVLSVLSFILALISIYFVIITLKQNNKMLEEASRPYIAIFFTTTTIHKRQNYFVIKNYGKSAGRIEKFIYPDKIKTSIQRCKDVKAQFECIENMVIAPGQSILLPYDTRNDPSHIFEFEITYSSNSSKGTYTENFRLYANPLVSRPPDDLYNNVFEHDLIFALDEISEKLI